MNKIMKYLPGLTGALCGYALLKFMTWTGLTFELGTFLPTCFVVTVLLDSAMQSYGKKI